MIAARVPSSRERLGRRDKGATGGAVDAPVLLSPSTDRDS